MENTKKHNSSYNKKKTNVKAKSSHKNVYKLENVKSTKYPFKKSRKTEIKNNFFNIDFEDSHDNDTPSCMLSQNSEVDVTNIFNNPKKNGGLKKKKIVDAFNVDFEESKEKFVEVVQSFSDITSQSLETTFNQDSTIGCKKTGLFKKPKQYKNHPFDIGLEESAEVLSQISQETHNLTASSQTCTNGPSEGAIGKNHLFQDQKGRSNKDFDVDFEDSCQQDTQNSQKTETSMSCSQKSTDGLSQDGVEKKQLFRGHKKHSNEDFDVDFEDSCQQETQNSKKTQTSLSCSQKSTDGLSQDGVEKKQLFRGHKKHSNEDFDVDFEDSCQQDTQNSQKTQTSMSCSQKSTDGLSQDGVEKKQLFRGHKKYSNEDFDVDFEDSCQQEAQNSQKTQTSMSCSQKSTDGLSQDGVEKKQLFRGHKKYSNEDFDVDFEDSCQQETQNSQKTQTSMSCSQKSTDGLSQDGVEKKQLFRGHKKHSNEDFDVDFEDSCQHETALRSQNIQSSSQCSVSNNENVEDTTLSIAKTDLLRKAKQRSLDITVDVNFEVSRNVTDALCISQETPTKSKLLPFRKSSLACRKDDCDVNLNESDVEADADSLTEKSSTARAMNVVSPISSAAGSNRMDTSEVSSYFNQSSLNDDNLDQWMSDHSEDENIIYERVETETDCRIALLPDNIPVPLDMPSKENHMERLQQELKKIVENAKNGRIHNRSTVLGEQNVTEKPKQREMNRGVSTKPKLKKPAPFATKRLYNHVIRKIRPKFGIDSVVQAEELVTFLCDVVRMVVRRKGYQKKLINELKMEMAKMGVIETTYQFYDFVRDFLPYEFRLKVVPCIQPGTNIVYPPRDAINPFEKIL